MEYRYVRRFDAGTAAGPSRSVQPGRRPLLGGGGRAIAGDPRNEELSGMRRLGGVLLEIPPYEQGECQPDHPPAGGAGTAVFRTGAAHADLAADLPGDRAGDS